jgi:hypothetical protein
MDANYAREMATLIAQKRDERYFDDIMLHINRAVSNGKLSVSYFGTFTKEMEDFLLRQGYSVSRQYNHTDGNYVTIKW